MRQGGVECVSLCREARGAQVGELHPALLSTWSGMGPNCAVGRDADAGRPTSNARATTSN